MRTPFPIVVTALLLVSASLGAWALSGQHGDAPEPGVDPREDAAAVEASVLVAGDGAAKLAEAGMEATRRTVDEPEPEITAPLPEHGLVVLVVDGADGRPVPGASVWFAERDDARGAQREADGPWNLIEAELVERFGTERRTDAFGRAVVVPSRERLLVAARQGDRFGFAVVRDGNQRELRLTLVPDETLELLVVEADGTPKTDVPVAVWCVGARGRPDRIWEGESDGDGRARIAHFQTVRPRGARRFGATFRFPLADAEPVEFVGDPAPREPVILRMPACGSVILSIVDRSGAPLFGLVRASLQSVRPNDRESWLPSWSDGSWARKEEGETSVTFPLVAVGTMLRAGARLDGRDTSWNGPAVTGPTFAGEVVKLTLETPDWLAVVTGRIVERDGSPLAGGRPAFVLHSGSSEVARERLRTAPDGRFEFGFRMRNVKPPYRLDVRDDRRSGPPAAGHAEIAAMAPGVRLDVGEIRLDGLEAVVTGRVVDDRGEPVAGAAVRLERAWFEGAKERWRSDRLTRTQTAEDGTYELFDTVDTTMPLRVRAALRNYVDVRSERFVGSVRLPDLVLVRTGEIDATLLLPDWMPDRALSGALMRAGESRPVEREGVRIADGKGRLRMHRIPPGTYDLRIDLRNHPAPLLVVAGIRVHPDEEQDARLSRIDLTGSLYAFEVRAVGPGGRPLDDVSGAVVGRVWMPDGQERWIGMQWRNGTARFIGSQPMAELWLLGMGHRPTQTWVAPGRTEVLLDPLHPVEVEMPGVRAAVGADRRVRVSLVYVGDTGLPTRLGGVDAWNGRRFSFERRLLGKSGGAWLGDSDRVRMDLQRNGRYQVVLRLYEEGVRGTASRVIDTVNVKLDGPTIDVVTAKVDVAKVQDAIAELRRRAER